MFENKTKYTAYAIETGFFTPSVLLHPFFFGTAAQQHKPILWQCRLFRLHLMRGGGMGDIGATMPDLYSQYWNAAKYPFISGTSGFRSLILPG